MNRSSCRYTAFFALLPAMLFSMPAAATFDLWRISEIFTNGDGRIQYIMLTTGAANQTELSGRILTSRSADGDDEQTFTFRSDLQGQTENQSLLIGTSALQAQTGLQVDFVIPDGFIFVDGGSIDFAGVDSFTYQRTALPKNGTQALAVDGTFPDAMPRNFFGESAQVSTDVAHRFNQSTGELFLPSVDVPGTGVVNATLVQTSPAPLRVGLSGSYIYDEGIVPGDGAARLIDGDRLYIPAGRVGNQLFEVNLTLLDQMDITFGNLEVLSVTDVDPPSPPDSGPDSGLEDSINAGEQIYSQLCSVCHGPQGNGTGSAPSLVASPRNTFELLRPFINDEMPNGNPAACTDNASSSCATDVANFVVNRLQGS